MAAALCAVVAVLLGGCAAAPWAVPDPPAAHVASWPPPGLRYLVERTKFLAQESQRFLGSRLVLSAQEERVNGQLMEWKRLEYNVPEAEFPPAHSFFLMKPRIEKSRVFQFIKRMPKGESGGGTRFRRSSCNFSKSSPKSGNESRQSRTALRGRTITPRKSD